MGLRDRKNWQKKSLEKAIKFEDDFFNVMNEYFEGTDYVIRKSPREFYNIYKNFELPKETLNEIYNPDKEIRSHGIIPDFAIDNIKTKKTIYGDNKRQDGWVENTTRYDGRGNAHERMCKYFTPGIQKKLREYGDIQSTDLPFWIVLRGNITRDPCRVREITLWFDNHTENVFFWRDENVSDKLINHFEKHIKPILDEKK
jgi:hypothetical protein